MDVTGWNLASRMKLPDYLFGNRKLISVYGWTTGPLTTTWAISPIVLPDPVCIWELNLFSDPYLNGYGYVRIGLADVVPTSVVEMDGAVELFPYFARPNVGPNRFFFYSGDPTQLAYQARKGMVTGGKFVVTELTAEFERMRMMVTLNTSELPTKVPGWPGAWPAS